MKHKIGNLRIDYPLGRCASQSPRRRLAGCDPRDSRCNSRAPKLEVYKEELVVGAAGLEPATLCLEGRCSIRLSYAPIV